MRKRKFYSMILLALVSLLCLACAVFFTACGNNETPDDGHNTEQGGENPNDDDEPGTDPDDDKDIAVKEVSLNKTSLTLEVGESYTLVVTVSPSNATDKNITWSSANSSVAAVSGGKVTAKSEGTTTITAEVHNGKTATCTVTVNEPVPEVIEVTSVSLNKTSLTLEIGESETLTATVLPSNATDKSVTWTSSAQSVATVANGRITAIGGGTATITATTSNGKTATCSVTVNEPAPEIIEVTSISLSQTSLTLEIGESQALTATVLPSNATAKSVTWTSSVQSVATVANGKVTAVGSGTATITATTSNGKTATCTVTVNAAVSRITQVEGATIDGTEIFMFVDPTTDSVALLNKVTVSSGRWNLYSDILGQNRIPTKIAAGSDGKLQNGDNMFYIMLENENGDLAEVYTLTVYRSYAVSVNYYNHKKVLVHSETAYTGYEYALNFDYSAPGYTFNVWEESSAAYQTRVLWDKLSLYADMTANEYTVALDANGGTVGTSEQEVIYDAAYSLPLPEREGYTFLGWYSGETQLTDERGQSLAAWRSTEDIELKAEWKINQYNVSVEYESSAGTVTGTAAGTYDYGTEITLTASAPDLGYAFSGWYLNGAFVTTENTYHFNLPANNVTLVAQYEVLSEMSVFTFTSSLTSCIITRIKDKTVTEIAVPDYVTEIEEGAFSGCASLESITLPFAGGSTSASSASSSTLFGYIFGRSSYTGSIATQQYYADSSCVTYYIPASLHSVTIMGGNVRYGAFYDCDGLTSITIGNSVTIIGSYAFYHCNGLTNVTIGSSVKSIGYRAFSGCYKLVEVYNQSLLSLSIGGSNNGFVAYYAKNVYTQVDGESWIMDTAEGYQFFYDGNEKVGYLLGYYGKDTSLTLPESFIAYDGTSVEEYEIYQYAFYNCSGLTSVAISDSVTNIGDYAFYGCSWLESITVATGNTVYHSAGNCLIETATGTLMLGCQNSIIPDNGSVTSIGNYAFQGCNGLTSITIPDSVTSIGRYAFSGCAGLTSMTIPASVTSIGEYAFSECAKIESITFDETSKWRIYRNSHLKAFRTYDSSDNVRSDLIEVWVDCSWVKDV